MAVNVNVIGRLGHDSEIMKNDNGEFLSFSLATDEFRHGTKSTTWLSVSYGNTKMAEWLKKGRMVNVIGVETVRTYTDKNGEVQVSRNINADKIDFVSIGSGTTQNNGSNVESASAPQNFTTGVLKKPTEQKTVQQNTTPPSNPMAENKSDEDDLPF
jgi:single-strand DNA-binding protein